MICFPSDIDLYFAHFTDGGKHTSSRPGFILGVWHPCCVLCAVLMSPSHVWIFDALNVQGSPQGTRRWVAKGNFPNIALTM